jgi:NAD+ synthase
MLAINPAKEVQKITTFIRNTLKKQEFKRLVIAVSGGVDSATSAFLVAQAIGVNNLYTLQLPYDGQSTHLSDLVIKKLKIPAKNVIKLDIAETVNTIISTLYKGRRVARARCESPSLGSPLWVTMKENAGQDPSPINKGNIIARVRMIIIFDTAKRLNALVCGTENRSEHLLGYFTRYGDSACDLEPIQHLYKTQVWQLAKYLGVPQPVIDAPPTAGLWPDQTDEKELGFSYQQADKVLSYLFDDKIKIKDIEQKVSRELVKKITARIKTNLFKHQAPYNLKCQMSKLKTTT